MRFLLPLFFILTCVLTTQVTSENNDDGKISGRVIDSVSNQPIEYDTIGLFLQGENKVVNGTTSDAKGFFKLSKIPKRDLEIVCQFHRFYNQ